MKLRLKDKVTLVSGGAGGIGRTTALLFSREGANVVVADIQKEKGEKAVKIIEELGGNAVFVMTDVTKDADAKRAVDTAVKVFGKLDILYNAAGAFWEYRELKDMSEEEWDRYIDVNLKSVFLLSKHAIHEMAKTGGGAIVNTSSIWAADMGAAGASAYVAAKAGIMGLTKSLALECAPLKIRVNAVCPGGTVTPMHMKAQGGTVEDERAALEKDPFFIPKYGELFTRGGKGSDGEKEHLKKHPIGRFGAPIDIANAALFFVSDESNWITGAILYVDGGYTA